MSITRNTCCSLMENKNMKTNTKETSAKPNYRNHLVTQSPNHLITFPKAAFTLAEVLITLAIIGIVAALTIPAIIAKYQKRVVVTKLQKDYALFSRMLNQSVADNGFMESWDYVGHYKTDVFFNKYLKPYLKIDKLCIPTSNECWADDVKSLSGISGYLKNTEKMRVSFIMNDGQSVFMWAASGSTLNDNSKPHLQFWIDINGKNKGPNMLGKDIFGMIALFATSRIYLQGMVDVEDLKPQTLDELMDLSDVSNCADTGDIWAGRYCGAVIQLSGWRIPDNYPW